MSTILKALRRLEGDRSAHEERPLRETVAASAGAEPRRPRRRGGWLFALVLLAGAGVGAGVLAFWSVAERDAEPTQLAAAPAPATEEAEAPAVVRVADLETEPSPPAASGSAAGSPGADVLPAEFESPPALPDAALASRVERMDRAPAGPRIDAAEEAERLEPQAAPPPTVRGQPLVPAEQLPGRHKRATRAEVLAAAKPPADAAASGASATATPGSAPVRRAPDPPAEAQPVAGEAAAANPRTAAAPRVDPKPEVVAAAAPPPAVAPAAVKSTTAPAAEPEPERAATSTAQAKPAASQLAAAEPAVPPASAVARADVPNLMVARTSWHPSAERRTAMVRVDTADAIEVREGDAVGLLVVARIEPSSVVFLHEGVEIRRRVGQR